MTEINVDLDGIVHKLRKMLRCEFFSNPRSACFASLVDVFVDDVEAGGLRAVDLVPPVADEVALIEEGPHGAEECVRAAVALAHVEDLHSQCNEEFS